MNWTNYRWAEGAAVIDNHINYHESASYWIPCVSVRLADFCLAIQWQANS